MRNAFCLALTITIPIPDAMDDSRITSLINDALTEFITATQKGKAGDGLKEIFVTNTGTFIEYRVLPHVKLKPWILERYRVLFAHNKRKMRSNRKKSDDSARLRGDAL